MRSLLHLAAATWLLLAAPQASYAQAPVDPAVTIEMSEQITRLMAARNVEEVLANLVKAMSSSAIVESLRGPLQGLSSLGDSQYSERVYARDFGRTTRDMIYKINFEQNILYVRYFFSIDKGQWRLVHFYFQTENALPFPRAWTHIYPL